MVQNDPRAKENIFRIQKLIGPEIFFGPKIFSDPKFFLIRNFFGPKFFGQEFFSDPNVFRVQDISDQIGYNLGGGGWSWRSQLPREPSSII